MKKAILIFIISLCTIPNLSLASGADTYTLLAPLPCISGVGNCSTGMQTEISLNDYIAYVYKFAIAISVFLAIVMIIWGGFLTVTSETPFKIEDGKNKIQNAVIGLAMVFASYLILLTVDPRLVDIKTQLPPIISSIDLNSMKNVNENFRNAIATDLSQRSNEATLRIIDMNETISNKEKEKKELEAFLNGHTEGQEVADAKLKVEQLANEIRNSKADVRVEMAKSAGSMAYARTHNILENPNKDANAGAGGDYTLEEYTTKQVPNTTVNGKLPTDTPNSIQRAYNIQINEILKDNSNYDKADILTKQRDFYIEQAQEEVKLDKMIDAKDKALEPILASYKKDIIDPAKQSTSGLSPLEYKAIYQARINTIEKIITPPKKP